MISIWKKYKWSIYPDLCIFLCLTDCFSHGSDGPFLVKFTQILESILLDNPHNAAVLSVGCASFSSTLFPSTQLSVNMLGYSTLWIASFFGNECLCLTLLVKSVNDCLLDNCQISSLPYDYVAQWTKLRDHFEGSGNPCRCFELISWLACHHILICWDSELVGFC